MEEENKEKGDRWNEEEETKKSDGRFPRGKIGVKHRRLD